jgi:hypothetical protein
MKHTLVLKSLCLAFLLSACENEWFDRTYQVELPQLPASWTDMLGSPDWRLEWISPQGTKEVLEIRGNQRPGIHILAEWTTPVTAYPFWSNRGIPPEIMRPAGALFPFDRDGGRIRLSWRGGIDAVLYQELGAQNAEVQTGTPRLPYYFNWIRFRELLTSRNINEGILKDPWSADWTAIARKTVQSGFDRRRVVPLPRKNMAIPVKHEGIWISQSPFAAPIRQNAGTDLSLQVCEQTDTYFSTVGMLRCAAGIWILTPWE